MSWFRTYLYEGGHADYLDVCLHHGDIQILAVRVVARGRCRSHSRSWLKCISSNVVQFYVCRLLRHVPERWRWFQTVGGLVLMSAPVKSTTVSSLECSVGAWC